MNWKVTEDNWNEEFRWFLVDEGEIQYAFKNRIAALTYQKQGRLVYMLLTDLDNITHDTMLDPGEFRSWSNKIQTCVGLE